MQGSLVSNSELIDFVAKRVIDIKPFEPERAQLAHYPLDPETFFIRRGAEWVYAHSFARSQRAFVVEANQYVVVEIRQHIAPGMGVVGMFVPSSNLIEQGLSLVAGKISYPFGQQNERIRFGLKNNIAEPCEIQPGDLVAYVQFFDLTQAKSVLYQLSERDMQIYEHRRRVADDDSVWALQNSDTDAPV